MELAEAIIQTIIIAATPLAFAALGEAVAEKSGVLNLGVEGMMIVGALAGFAVTLESGSHVAGVVAAAGAGVAAALVFGMLTQFLLSNQVATGLALTIFCLGLAALAGHGYSGQPLPRLPSIEIPVLSDIPLLGGAFFSHDLLVYASVALAFAIAWFLKHTRAGMVLRAVGENHDAAHALGYPVVLVRLAALAFGGAMAGIGGGYLSMAQTPQWVEGMTAGKGWIALAIVVFASWRPGRVLAGAYLFGGVSVIQLHIQGMGVDISAQFLAMLPYIATIVVLALISRDTTRAKLNAPGSLGRPFHASG